MEQFRYSVQAKITVWEETFYNFHAENNEEAEKIIKDFAVNGLANIKNKKLIEELDNYDWELLEETIGDLDSSLQPYEIYDSETAEIIESSYRTI
jgi:hypothetical protein